MRSQLAVQTIRPSGLNRPAVSPCWWVITLPRGEPSATFHSLAVASQPVVKTVLPSGLNAMAEPADWVSGLQAGEPLAPVQSLAVPSVLVVPTKRRRG